MIGSLPPPELAMVLRTLAVLTLGAWAARPAALRLVPGGTGWVAALVLAWAVIGWLPWALAALGLMPFGAAAPIGLAGLMVARAWLGPVPGAAREGIVAITALAVLIWFGMAQRLGLADLTGLEKFTDMGLLAAAMRSEWMPPQDAWYAGAPVNYYYVGQAMVASWGHIAGAPPAATYQIAMALLFALTGLATWRLTVALAAGFGIRIAQVLGAAAAALTLYGGNFHSVLYTLWRGVVPTAKEAFYYPDSTRFIGFDPPAPDKGFTEFPAYAFAVGDLHAHVIATPIFLFGLMVVLAILRRGLRRDAPDPAQAAALGWVLGLCAAINAWDVAVLGLIALIVALVLAVQEHPAQAAWLDRLGVAMVVALGVAFVTAAPFLGRFTPFASGFEPAPARTPLWQLLVLYAHVLPAVALFLFGMRHAPAAKQLAITLVLVAALILIALPEAVIVRDIYGLDFARANTMFKLTFRAQSLLVIGGLAALAPAIAQGGAWFAAALVAAAPMVATLAYAPHIFRPPSVIRSLDGQGFLGDERALVAAAGRLGLAPGEALIEASGDAFGETARVSAMTGLPVVIGWAGHEWLWRGDGAAANGRAGRVRTFYTTGSDAERCAIIRRFNIRHVILGQVEQRTYPDLDIQGLSSLGPAIYEGAGGKILRIAPERCF